MPHPQFLHHSQQVNHPPKPYLFLPLQHRQQLQQRQQTKTKETTQRMPQVQPAPQQVQPPPQRGQPPLQQGKHVPPPQFATLQPFSVTQMQPRYIVPQHQQFPPPHMFHPQENYYYPPLYQPHHQLPHTPRPTTTTTTTTTTTAPEMEGETEVKSGTPAPQINTQCNYWVMDRGVQKWYPCPMPPQASTTTLRTTTRPHYWYIQKGVYKWYPCPTPPVPTTMQTTFGIFDFIIDPPTTQLPMHVVPVVRPGPVKVDITYTEVEQSK
ncbi:ataxin-2 homolog [Ostrea edulis]|uniref:ataxin-2 homolog n=1 Tax=Ostrea edulis TaxID=37623 RepID=UPI0024AEF075|nr:ataxin-2 homolog [Ostrea edulis]